MIGQHKHDTKIAEQMKKDIKELLKDKCEVAGFHTWQDVNGNVNIENTGADDTEMTEVTLTCNVCGATCEMFGDWEKAE